MKKFNINHHMYIQITKEGWEHLHSKYRIEYINTCIKQHRVEINNEIWYKLQCHSVFELSPVIFGSDILFSTNVMFDEKDLSDE